MPVEPVDLLGLASFIFAETDWGTEESDASALLCRRPEEQSVATADPDAQRGGAWSAP